MKLPAPVQAFFDADLDPTCQPPTDAFAPDAIVKDEGKAHVGRKAIATWWKSSKDEYQAVAMPRDMLEQNGSTVVRADVSGKFPDSPISLRFAFHLKNQQITALEIGG